MVSQWRRGKWNKTHAKISYLRKEKKDENNAKDEATDVIKKEVREWEWACVQNGH